MAREERCVSWQEGAGIWKANESASHTDGGLLGAPMRRSACGWGWKDKDNGENISSPVRST